ncbi:unnamed protein product [Adineta ricciae]|uniref:TIR domain-containing protein n=1 Tax=Adineta ricciae TaxID=249248 RepID=A0A814IJ85_ADIRI|nr:unnamed protein product [Adineta ricciae]CAF1460324.1 unnamed protein product [Adineta ricciae]
MENSTTRADRDILKKVKLDIDQLTITNAALQDEYVVTYVMSTVHHDLQNVIENGIAQSDLAQKVMQIICQGLANGYRKSIHPSIERHEFWQIFHSTFLFILENTCHSSDYTLTENNTKTFKSMCLLLNSLKSSQNKTHPVIHKCLFTDRIIEMFRKCLILVSNDSSLMIRCIVLKEILHCFCLNISSHMREQIQSQILEPCLRCLLSKLYIESFDHLDKEYAVFFTETCPLYISTYCTNQDEQIAIKLYEPFLKYWSCIYRKSFSSSSDCQLEKFEIRNYKYNSNAFIRYLEILIICATFKSTREQFPNDIIKDLLDIIVSLTEVHIDKSGQSLFSIKHKSQVYIVLVLLYNLTLSTRLVSILKDLAESNNGKEKYNETLIFLCKYKDRSQDEANVEKKRRYEEKIQFLAKNLFALIIDNIDDLQQPGDLASKYATYLSSMVENSTQIHGGIHLRTLLQAMQVITQNRHMRNALIDQNGLPSLTKSACVEEFDRDTIQQLALDLIWTISFNSKAAKFWKIDKRFIAKLKSLLQSNKPELKFSADGILWRLEGEEEFQLKKAQERGVSVDRNTNLSNSIEEDRTRVWVTIETNGMKLEKLHANLKPEELEQLEEKRIKNENVERKNAPVNVHSIMISYSHENADMCHLIHECLVKTKKYEVWIDKEKMYGSLMERMAEAIEQSETILICASGTYKTSQACQSEAEYAYKKKRRMIFVKVEPKYTPNGWLGLLFANNHYIDFIKNDFSKAFRDLYEQLHRHRNNEIPDHSILDQILTRDVLDKAADIVQKMKEKNQQTTAPPSSNINSSIPVISNVNNATYIDNLNTPGELTNRSSTPVVPDKISPTFSDDSKLTIKGVKVHINKKVSNPMHISSTPISPVLRPETPPRSERTSDRLRNSTPVPNSINPKNVLPPIVSARSSASSHKMHDSIHADSKSSQSMDHSNNHDEPILILSDANLKSDNNDYISLSPLSISSNRDYEYDFLSDIETDSEDDTSSCVIEQSREEKAVDQWSQQDVLKFLLEKKLTSILKLFGNDTINGNRLLELYSVITPKSVQSLNKLRDILNSSQTITIPVDDLERFQEELRKVIPKTSCDESVFCDIM